MTDSLNHNNKATVELSWEMAQAYLKASYATEFSIENRIEKTSFIPCIPFAEKSEINFTYKHSHGESLIFLYKSAFISATLFPTKGQMTVVYFDIRRRMETKLTINFLNKYLPELVRDDIPSQ